MNNKLRNIILFYFLFHCLQLSAQSREEADKKMITEKVNHFFEALEKKDTILYSSIVMPSAQIWVVRMFKDTLRNPMRTFSEDFKRLAIMKETIEEKPFKYTISIHNDIAVVWAPYTLSLSGKFSHCGIDVFTLLNTPDNWKIVSAVYSVEPGGCAEIQKL